MTRRLELPKFQAFDANGDPLSGGKVYTYEVGTSTLKTSYSDYDASTANANPVVLDSRGEADIYVKGAYKISVYTSADVLVWTLDNVQGGIGEDGQGENYYYPDSTASDQGATGNSDTIKYAIDTISTDTGTIYLRHNSGSATTTYTLTTSDTLPDNVKLEIENGAIIDGAGTLTLASPEQLDVGEDQQIFGSSLTVAFTKTGTVYPEWWGAKSGNTDDTTEVQAALDCRGHVVLSAEYNVTGVYVSPGTRIEGRAFHADGTSYLNAGFKLIASSDPEGVLMTENVETGFSDDWNMHAIFISNIYIDGNRDNNSTGHGIYQVSSGFVNEIRNVQIKECAQDGIHLGGEGVAYADRATISSVGISNCDRAGIYLEGDTGYTSVLLESVKVDNCLSGIYVNGGTGATLGSIVITNYRSEVSGSVGATIMANSIHLYDCNGCQVAIIGAKFFRAASTSTQRSGGAIKIENQAPRLFVTGAYQNTPDSNSAYANLLDDDAASTDIEDTAMNFFASTPSGTDDAQVFSRQVDVKYKDGDTGLNVFLWGESYARAQLYSSALRFGAGSATPDVYIGRDTAGSISCTLPTHTQKTSIRIKETEITSMSGATETWTAAIPAGSMVLGVSARVTTLVEGATSIDIGEAGGGDADLFIDGMDVALDTTASLADVNSSFTGPKIYTSETGILVTANGSDFTAGSLRLTLHYIVLGAPID
jgi:hypothetical protein